MLFYVQRLLSVIVIFCYIPYICTKINSYNPYCYVKECCNEDWIKFDRERLLRNLTDRVYGQPLVKTAVDALSSHFNPYFSPKKALTLSFHGMPGTGKNYVSKFIAESMFTEGTKSKYVHHFIGRMHFPYNSKIEEYRTDLYSWLKGNISSCARRLFIFDGAYDMIPEVLNIINPMIDYQDDREGISYSQAVFIFLSHTGSHIINERSHDLIIKEGKTRESLKIYDFETLIQQGAFNKKGGFHNSDTIKGHLIDHYIPFLPLEEKHIIMCIKDEFKVRKVLNPKKEHIEQILRYVEWGPESSKKFSKSGCKRLAQKVAILVDNYHPQYFKNNGEL